MAAKFLWVLLALCSGGELVGGRKCQVKRIVNVRESLPILAGSEECLNSISGVALSAEDSGGVVGGLTVFGRGDADRGAACGNLVGKWLMREGSEEQMAVELKELGRGWLWETFSRPVLRRQNLDGKADDGNGGTWMWCQHNEEQLVVNGQEGGRQQRMRNAGTAILGKDNCCGSAAGVVLQVKIVLFDGNAEQHGERMAALEVDVEGACDNLSDAREEDVKASAVSVEEALTEEEGKGLPRVEVAVLGEGAHQSMRLSWPFGSMMAGAGTAGFEYCRLVTVHSLPRESFVDLDELARWGRRAIASRVECADGQSPSADDKFSCGGLAVDSVVAEPLHHVDVEKPSYASPGSHFVVQLEVRRLADGVAVVDDDTVLEVDVPVHLRYQSPSPVGSGATLSVASLPLPPYVAAYCSTAPRSSTTTLSLGAGTFAEKERRWFLSTAWSSTKGQRRGEVHVPVGRLDDLLIVALLSSIFSLAGCVAIFWSLTNHPKHKVLLSSSSWSKASKVQ